MKIIKMEDDIHKIAKDTAKELGMTLQGFLKMAVLKLHGKSDEILELKDILQRKRDEKKAT